MEKWGSPSTTKQSVLKNSEKKGVAFPAIWLTDLLKNYSGSP
jgi:hypothetical protein